MSGSWVCEACARRLQLPAGGGPSYASGLGWCGAGQHQTAPGERIVWHGRAMEAARESAASAAPTAVRRAEQLSLF